MNQPPHDPAPRNHPVVEFIARRPRMATRMPAEYIDDGTAETCVWNGGPPESGWCSGSGSAEVERERLIRELRSSPAIVGRLLVVHVPDGESRCRECPLPGLGAGRAPWPCSLYRLAQEARCPVVVSESSTDQEEG